MTTPEHISKDIRILVVDDHEITCVLVKSILKAHGFVNVFTAGSGHEARSQIDRLGIQLVICDRNMPNGSGLELLCDVRADAKLKDLPFLMLTAEAYMEIMKEALKAGVTDYIVKPFTAEVLLTKLAEAWQKKLT